LDICPGPPEFLVTPLRKMKMKMKLTGYQGRRRAASESVVQLVTSDL